MTYRALMTAWIKVLSVAHAAFRREDSPGLAMRGAIISIAEDHGSHPGGINNVIDFFSRRQRKVVRSTFGAETHSLADSIEIARMIAYSLAEILVPNSTAAMLVSLDEQGRLPVKIHAVTDCKSLLDALIAEETQVPSENSLIMVLLQIKEGLRTGTIASLTWVDTRDMLADALNKGTIARHHIVDFSNSAVWHLKHEFQTHREPTLQAIPSVAQAIG